MIDYCIHVVKDFMGNDTIIAAIFDQCLGVDWSLFEASSSAQYIMKLSQM